MSILKSIYWRLIPRFRKVLVILSVSSFFFVVNHHRQLQDSSYEPLNYFSSPKFNDVSIFSATSDFVIGNKPSLSYTNYTVHRLGLRPLDGGRFIALFPEYGPVINDVLSFEYPIDIIEVKNKCNQWKNESFLKTAQTDVRKSVLVVVVSAAKNVEQRALIRQTWGKNPKLREAEWLEVIFLIGSLSYQSEFDRDTQLLIKEESLLHGDVVQVNVVDSYKNLTLKSVAMLHWVYTRCPNVQLVIKCDDDNYVNYEVLEKITPHLNDTNSIYGTKVSTLRPARSKRHKHYISRQAWPWPRYPLYLMGGSYALAGQVVRQMLAAAQTTPLFPFEDVYIMGLCAKKASVHLRTKPQYYEPDFPGTSNLDACFIRKNAVWQTLSTIEFARSHRITKRVYRQNITCKTLKTKTSCNYMGLFC